MIPLISEAMRGHDAIFLEEPPAPGFDRMIRGELSIDDYLLPIDVEYPLFSRKMCDLLQDLYAEGKAILQVEPFGRKSSKASTNSSPRVISRRI